MSRKSDIPFSGQFTPQQTPLPQLLRLLPDNAGNERQLLDAIISSFFSNHAGDQEKLAKNTVLALIAYGILDRERKLTPFGQELVTLADDEPRLYERFARHILLNLRGLEVINTLLDMHRARAKMDLTTIREALEEHGIHMPRGGTHFSGMKNWLQMAGVIDDDYNINEARVQQLIGASLEDVDTLSSMTRELRAFLKALVNLVPNEPIPSNQVAEYANRIYGVKYPDKSLPKLLEPLVKAGFITMEKTTEGRGAKPHVVALTPKTQTEYLLPLLKSLKKATRRSVYNKPLADILAEVASNDRYVKGRALEELAIYLCRLLDLKFRSWRLRGQATGGAEVDVLMEGDRFIFSRWQVQCKNTGLVRTDDVAKEVGLAIHLKSNVILVVSTGDFAKDARKYADAIMKSTNLQIILLDGRDLKVLTKEPTRIVNILDREAQHAMDIKRIEVDTDA